MLRVINRLSELRISPSSLSNYSSYSLPYDPALVPVKKCHRKPRWLPTAKSKRFRVPERPKIPEDEAKEILRLHNNYRNNVKSLKRYLVKKHCTIYQESLDPEEILKHFKEDFEVCSEINGKWNEEVKISREKRIAEQLESDLDFARKRIEEEIIKEEQLIELADNIVRKEKEASASFINPENIDLAIDRALAEETDYNFALDINGEKLFGRETKSAVEKLSLKQ